MRVTAMGLLLRAWVLAAVVRPSPGPMSGLVAANPLVLVFAWVYARPTNPFLLLPPLCAMQVAVSFPGVAAAFFWFGAWASIALLAAMVVGALQGRSR